MDVEKMPCITIAIGSNMEDKSLARLADQTECIETYEASDIGKTIQYIVPPFQYTTYDQPSGLITTPESVDIGLVNPGMVIIDPTTGNGFVVSRVEINSIYIAPGSNLTATEVGVLPQYRTFRARREIATFQEKITVGCHVHGDPNALLWLYSFMMYGLLRYREGVLESRNFQLSNIETSDMVRNHNFESVGENVYSRFITISGQVENTWVKAPKRIIETVQVSNDGNPGEGCPVGICISIIGADGGQIPEIIDTENEMWAAKDDED
jgi:hypothetical protein